MSVEITFRDETTSGEVLHQLAMQLQSEHVTVRELITVRVHEEVRVHNAKLSGPFVGLVQPGEHESQLNRARLPKRVDADEQAVVALHAFERGRVLLLVDDKQVTELSDEVELNSGSTVTFLKLTPLVGG